MKSLLTDAARVLAPIVNETGQTRDMSILAIADLLRLPLEQATTIVQRVSHAGFIEIVEDRIQPTLPGVAVGAALAMSRNRVRQHINRLSGGPYWTYLPQEVNLSG